MTLEQLRALAAIIDEGTFEAAADVLVISPSAVSQRIKALESSIGQVLVRRAVPCVPTEAGAVVLRMARQVQVLADEARRSLGAGASQRSVTPLAVNADSLATWFLPVLSQAGGWSDTTLDLHVEDQAHSSQLLRQGDVIGGVTSDPMPVSGCRVEALGVMRYIPAASPTLLDRFSTETGIAWAEIPVVHFNAKDDLQRRALRESGIHPHPPAHTVPSSQGFLAAVQAGLGWGMLPELQLTEALADGSLVVLPQHAHQDVPLYWQAWALDSRRLQRIGEAVKNAARRQLRTLPDSSGAPRTYGALVEAGLIRPGHGDPLDIEPVMAPPGTPSSQEILDEIRADREW